MSTNKKRKKHHTDHSDNTARSGKGRRKAFILLIILGVVVMCVYFLSLQQFEDSELIEETSPAATEQLDAQ